MPIKNFYAVTSIEPGDMLVCTVKLVVGQVREARLYRCPYPNPEIGDDGTPQGDALYPKTSEEWQVILHTLFPVTKYLFF